MLLVARHYTFEPFVLVAWSTVIIINSVASGMAMASPRGGRIPSSTSTSGTDAAPVLIRSNINICERGVLP